MLGERGGQWGVQTSLRPWGYGTGGNVSRGDHPSLPNKSQYTSSTLFVTGVGLCYSMNCFEKPSTNPIYHSFRVVYGLVIQGGVYLGISTELQ